jgi:hypothetical protein
MDARTILKKIMTKRTLQLEILKEGLEKIESIGLIVADTEKSCNIPEPKISIQYDPQLEKFKRDILQMKETFLILDCPLGIRGEYSETAIDDDFDLKGLVVADAIKRYKGDRGNTAAEKKEHLRRAHFIHSMISRGLLPLRIVHETIDGKKSTAGMPIRAFLKFCASQTLQSLHDLPDHQKSTIKDYQNEFRVLASIMSELVTGVKHNFPQEFEIPLSIVKDLRKDNLLRADQMAKLFYEFEQEALTDKTKNQSKVRDLIIFRLLFYIGDQQVDIQELLDLHVSKIGFKRCVIHFKKCRVHCSKDFMKLLKAYIGCRENLVFVGIGETPLEPTWLNKKLSRILSKLEFLEKTKDSSKTKIVPSTIQKSALQIKRSLLMYANTLENTGTIQNCNENQVLNI